MPEDTAAQPRFLDTYALVYAFTVTLLVPALALLARLPFRTYTFAYVSLVAVPFALGLLATFLTDNHDPFKTSLVRAVVLLPLSAGTGVGVLFIGALSVIPISPFLHPENYGFTTPFVVALLATLAAPLVLAIARRVRRRPDWRTVVQLVALFSAIAVAVGVGVLMFGPAGALRGFARKDVTIYITGALMWYGPSFGIAAGIWRRIPIVHDAPATPASAAC